MAARVIIHRDGGDPKGYAEKRAKTEKAAETRGGRRTAPEDHRPYSPDYIDRLYTKDRHLPGHNSADGDGLVPQKLHNLEVEMQRPQTMVDGRLSDLEHYDLNTGRLKNNYKNSAFDDGEVPLKGRGAWKRGGGGDGAEGKPDFDRVGIPKSPKGARCTATGQDMTKSPFSNANRNHNKRG
jgi:hypothetical protein